MKTPRNPFRMLEREQRMVPSIEDSYRTDRKLPEPTRCPRCGATFRKGRWTWKKAGAEAHVERCPACRRIEDRFPGGYVTLKGRFDGEHRAELLNLVRARETHASAEHPLQRIMDIEDTSEGIRVTTTDLHLARSIARALHDAFDGTLDVKYARDDNLLRAVWRARPRNRS